MKCHLETKTKWIFIIINNNKIIWIECVLNEMEILNNWFGARQLVNCCIYTSETLQIIIRIINIQVASYVPIANNNQWNQMRLHIEGRCMISSLYTLITFKQLTLDHRWIIEPHIEQMNPIYGFSYVWVCYIICIGDPLTDKNLSISIYK